MKPVFVHTANVRSFISTMQLVRKRMGTDSLAMIFGRAGRGKTRTAHWYATQNDCVFVQSLRDWSVLWMYQDILAAYGVVAESIPKRKKDAYEMILDICAADPKPVLLDEADLIGARLLETVRDLCKMTRVPWVLIGEEGLPVMFNRDRRVWSRRCASLEFLAMTPADVTVFGAEACDLKLAPEAAELIQRATGGDVRLIELTLSTLEVMAHANRARDISADLAKAAVLKVLPEQKR